MESDPSLEHNSIRHTTFFSEEPYMQHGRNQIPTEWDKPSLGNPMPPSYPPNAPYYSASQLESGQMYPTSTAAATDMHSIELSQITVHPMEEKIKLLQTTLDRVHVLSAEQKKIVESLQKSLKDICNGFLVVTLLSWGFYWLIS